MSKSGPTTNKEMEENEKRKAGIDLKKGNANYCQGCSKPQALCICKKGKKKKGSSSGESEQLSTDTEALSLSSIAEYHDIPAISVASASDICEIEIDAFGVTSRNSPTEVTEETIFEAASLSKPVFAYIVLKMAERGEIDLDKPLIEILNEKFGEGHQNAQYGPPFPGIRDHENYKMLTPRMLLAHQAGLPNEFGRPIGPPEYNFISNANQGFDYSGEAYRFLMEVVDKLVDPKSVEDLAQEEFSKLGMNNSSFLRPDTSNIAIGHHLNGETDNRQHFFGIHPAGSLHTTPEDYVKFLNACVNDAFVRKEMFKSCVDTLKGKDNIGIKQGISSDILSDLQWGLGIGLQKNSGGTMTAFHWGDNRGTCRNFAAINLDTNKSVACFTNSANGPAAFKQICEPIVGDLSVVSQWLAKRENLPTLPKPKPEKKLEDESSERGLTNALVLHKSKHVYDVKPQRVVEKPNEGKDIFDEQMANSTLGQESNTAKINKFRKS